MPEGSSAEIVRQAIAFPKDPGIITVPASVNKVPCYFLRNMLCSAVSGVNVFSEVINNEVIIILSDVIIRCSCSAVISKLFSSRADGQCHCSQDAELTYRKKNKNAEVTDISKL